MKVSLKLVYSDGPYTEADIQREDRRVWTVHTFVEEVHHVGEFEN